MFQFFKIAFLSCIAALVVFAHAEEVDVVTFERLLEEMVNRDQIARFPALGNYGKQFSSYDRRSVSPEDKDWFANEDWSNFIRSEKVEDRTEWVMAETEGPGSIVRIWIGGPKPKGMIRIYLDGSDKPVITADPYELLTGGAFVPEPLAIQNGKGYWPNDPGGLNLMMPMPFKKHCKITYDGPNTRETKDGKDCIWYIINTAQYDAEVKVKTFTMSDFRQSEKLVKEVAKKLSSPQEYNGGTVNTLDKEVASNGEESITLPAGSAAVRNLSIQLEAQDLEQALRSTIIKMTFDGQQTVWSPVGDFFGSGVGINSFSDWYRSVEDDGKLGCRWVMPYEKTGAISVVNLGSQSVKVALEVKTDKWEWDDQSMHFHANWRQQRDFSTRPFSDWNYIEISGTGVYVGNTLILTNPVHNWWGEGDEKIWVDDDKFPSFYGTGTEDFYGYAWGSPELFEGPFCTQVLVDGPVRNLGHTVISRVNILDSIPFNEKFKFDMEVWHWKPCQVSYATSVFWYALPGADCNVQPMPDEASREITQHPKWVMEFENLEIINKSANLNTALKKVEEVKYPWGWSDGTHFCMESNKSGDSIEFLVPLEDTMPVNLTLYATKNNKSGPLKVEVNGIEVNKKVDLYSDQIQLSGPIEIGTFDPSDGGIKLKFKLACNNLSPDESCYGFDFIAISPQEFQRSLSKK